MKGLLRFAAIWAISMALTPYVNRFFDRMLLRIPRESFWFDIVGELRDQHATTLIRSFGETAGEMVFGPSSKGRG